MKLILITIFCISLVNSEELCTLKKSRCSPESLNECVQTEEEQEANEDFGYEGLGCFSTRSPWTSLIRPLPPPSPPAFIDVEIYLYTRNTPKSYTVILWPSIVITGLDFDAKRQTVFIIHGFLSSGNSSWILDMTNAYLSKVDANVFVVNWEKGSTIKNYFQAASNTRIVGAELTRFLNYLVESHQLNTAAVHLIGHSLGAHTAAYAAKVVSGIGRITALDPAQPCFEKTDKLVKLAKGDADFIDVIHTNAKPFIPFLGFGMMESVGDVDFYVNGGQNQPGCSSPTLPKSIKSLKDISGIDISKWVSCSHTLAHDYFTASLESNVCLLEEK